jgi:hypothetical protein
VASILQNLRNPRPVRSNERGSFAGSSVTRGKSTSFYDGKAGSPAAPSGTVIGRRSMMAAVASPAR